MADKKTTLFHIGSALDKDEGWKFEENAVPTKSFEIKPPEKHFLVLKMEKRQGKPVSLVGPFFLKKEELKNLCTLLKKKLGSGGTCKDEWLEFQGECRDKIKQLLLTEGFRFKG